MIWHFVALGLATTFACATPPAPRARPAVTKTVAPACLAAARAAARLDPEAPRSFLAAHEAFTRGRDLEAAGELDGAKTAYGAAVKADPSHGLARLALAEVHWRTDNDIEAIHQHLAAAVVLLPENPRAHLRFAAVNDERGDPEVAARHYACALTLKPGLPEAQSALARHELRAGRPAAAERHVRKALEVEPDDYRHHILLSQALEARDALPEAAAAAARAAEIVGRSAPLFRRAAGLFDRAEDPGRAASMRARADEIDPPPKARELRPLRKARKKRRSRKRRR